MSNSSRRDILRRGAAGLVVLMAGGACKKESRPFTCTDTAALAPADMAVRTALGYVEPSTEAGKDCNGCVQFVPSPTEATSSCGTCKLMKGPIHPKGYCKGFAAKA